tara:strand:- start:134 stop:385 length:252 start_codon:yes stop_codon:yes gene_type:complete
MEEKFDKMVQGIAMGKVTASLGHDNMWIPSPCGSGIMLTKEAFKMYEFERQEAVVSLADLFDIPLQYFLDNDMLDYDHWDKWC